MKRSVILASQSPRRKQLLAECGWSEFKVIPSDVKEITPSPENWFCIALLNATLKAEDIAGKYPEAIVIGADTVIEFNHQAIGKPENAAKAFEMLRAFSGKEHIVTTGLCIRCIAMDLKVQFAEHSKVFFRELSDETIQDYLQEVPVLDKAGAYAIQDHGDWLIDHIEGSLRNIIGFPAERFTEAMKNIELLEN